MPLDASSLRESYPSDYPSVGLAGLFVLEPLMTPALFQRYPGTKDEWSLSLAMAADTANGGLKQLEDHYNTFIVSLIPSPFLSLCTYRREVH